MGLRTWANITATKLKRVAQLSGENPRMEFIGFMPHVNKESLISCFNELDGRGSVGIDRITKEEYGQALERNIENLLNRMRCMSYYPSPVREVLIPKDGGKFRPLGISILILFEFSWDLPCAKTGKLKQDRYIRYIVRMLKSGVLSEGELSKTDERTPQGSCCSPILSNIFAHYALDIWFNTSVKSHTRGEVKMFRYCDDFIICCELQEDVDRIQRALKGRLQRFSLKMNEEKTQQVRFSRAEAQRGKKQGTFDYLGFTFYLGRARKGFYVVKVKTSRKRIRIKLQVVKGWCRTHRHRAKLRELWKRFCVKLRGHNQYYGVSDNIRSVSAFFNKAIWIFFKWMNRRSEKRSFSWEKFHRYLKDFPPPRIIVCHRLY